MQEKENKMSYQENKDNEFNEIKNTLNGSLKTNVKRKTKSKYNNSLRSAIQKVAQMTYNEAIDGSKITVAEKMAMSCVAKIIQDGNATQYQAMAKVSGDLVEKQEVNISGLEALLDKAKDDSKF